MAEFALSSGYDYIMAEGGVAMGRGLAINPLIDLFMCSLYNYNRREETRVIKGYISGLAGLSENDGFTWQEVVCLQLSNGVSETL